MPDRSAAGPVAAPDAGRAAGGRDRAGTVVTGAAGKSGAAAGAGGDRRPAVRAQAPRPGRGLDHAGLRLPARRAAGAVGAGHPGPAAGLLQPADRRRSRRRTAAGPASRGRVRRADARRVAVAGAGHRRADPAWLSTSPVPAAHGRAARRVLGRAAREVRGRPGHAPVPGAVPVAGGGRGCDRLGAPGAAAGRPGLAAAGRGRAGRGGGGAPLARDPGPLVERAGAARRRRSCTATGSWTTWAPTTRAGPCCWTGSSRAAARALSDLAWYLAINCRRLPQSKEAAIAVYRPALEAAGIDTEPWWDRQLALCLLGALVQFGWEKALGGYDEELAWWQTRRCGAPLLG